MMVLIIAVSAGICVAAIVGAVAMMVRGDESSVAEDRLSTLTARSRNDREGADASALTLRNPLDGTTNALEQWMTRQFNMKVLLEQAGIKMPLNKFALICFGLAGVGTIGCLFAPIPFFVAPVAGIILFFIPFFWVNIKKKKRINKFNMQLPEALEMLSRSLRAGHSLGAGFGLISDEMPEPLGREFGRCFEEQNFGVSLEQSLESMTQRIPNLDLRFFATAVILQRQTGGDLAEILEKIGNLVRSRYRLAGHIQSLTGEGRLSGIVLLGLPPALFTFMLWGNNEYIMKLFTDPMGRQLLGGAIFMQFIGALVIRKIIDIKV